MTKRSTFEYDSVLRVSADTRSIDLDALRTTAAEVGAEELSIVEVGPTGVPALEPYVAATLTDRTAFFTQCDHQRAENAIEALQQNELPTNGVTAVVEHDSETTILPNPDITLLTVGDRRVLGACGWAVPTSEADYVARGPLLADGNTDLLNRAAEAGLRGRGRGDIAMNEPIIDYWKTAVSADEKPVVVIHANEADPRVNVDSLLLASDPFAVLDPAVAVADRIGGSDLVVYLNESDESIHQSTVTAAERVEGFAAHDVSIDVVMGPDEYKAGEPTMVLEALEGNDRIEARRSPPGPAEYGLYGRPTVIHTPRTLVQLRANAVEKATIGVDTDPGTRLFEIGGDVAMAGIVELPTSAPLSAATETLGGDQANIMCVGGVFGGFTEQIDIEANIHDLTAAGLGANSAIELFGERKCPVALAGQRTMFAHETNCGRCVPCREGSTQLAELLRTTYENEDAITAARELARVMERSSLCGFGRAAARPVMTALDSFETEFIAHANGRCPAGECEGGKA